MYLNLDTLKKDRYVYRITTINRVKELFSSGLNTLVKPRKWDDPFENFILRSRVRLKSGEVVQYNLHEAMYGQCWTFHKASDAMWRIYAPDKNGIRLRSRVDLLGYWLAKAHPKLAEAQCRIGRVRYLRAQELEQVANATFDDDGIGLDELFASLLVKRKAFEHERELRLLYFELGEEAADQNELYNYPVDPHAMIDQMMLDPRLSGDEAESLKREIRSATGFQGDIKRSLLYAPPQENICLLYTSPSPRD